MQNGDEQRFELDLETDDGPYQYRLGIEYHADRRRMRINKETLLHAGKPSVVVIDADTRSRNTRPRQLRVECERKGVPPRKPADPILVFVPRRNIETWFAYLDGREVNERAACPKRSRDGECSRHAKELVRPGSREQKPREPALPSLRDAGEEHPRLAAILR